MKRILVTGSTGFIGSRLIKFLDDRYEIESVNLRNIDVDHYSFKGISAVVHLAGLAHQMKNMDEQEYFKINTDLTLKLALAAKSDGVGHFVFMSTIKVFGLDWSDLPISLEVACNPMDAYGRSKLNAEIGLNELASKDFSVTNIRTPLVYGPGVKGNLETVIRLIKNYPLVPFGGIYNRRSMIYVDNLIDLIDHIIFKNKNGTILPSDSVAISTTQLVDEIIGSLNLKTRNFSMPSFFRFIIKLVKPNVYNRIFRSLEIDSSSEGISFEPKVGFEKGIKKMSKDVG